MLACNYAASADLQVGQLTGPHLVIQQVAGQPGNRRSLIDAVSQPIVRVRARHRFHLDHLGAWTSWSPGVAEDGRNRGSAQTARSFYYARPKSPGRSVLPAAGAAPTR